MATDYGFEHDLEHVFANGGIILTGMVSDIWHNYLIH